TPGVGSTFWFDLQVPEVAISIQPMSLKSTQHIIGYSGEKRKILVVDDRWENRSVLINMLEPIGFELQEATNGQEGLDRAVEFQPDLILADLIMPAMDGFEMTRRLRQLSELQTTNIIAVSANAFEVSRQKCLESGCNDFLTKPIQSQALFDKIKDYLNLSWIYDNTDELQSSGLASSQNPPSSPAEMVFPPRHELLPLYEAVLTGDVEAVEYELIRIQEVSVEYMSFVIRVLELAQEFDYEQIAQFIEPYLS
ncbi:MAG TPA: response regulator, partial [Coleofasciculaceae cyanobacterium]